MSDLSNTPKIQDELYNGQGTPSPGTMLFTLILLIAGLVLASVLMMNHVYKAKAEAGEEGPGFAELVEKVKDMTVHAPPQETEEAPESSTPQSSTLENLKNMVTGAGSADKVRWPRLRLTGFGTATDSQESFAIINGEHVHPGQVVDKVTVVEVREYDVLVEYKGESKTLTVNVQD